MSSLTRNPTPIGRLFGVSDDGKCIAGGAKALFMFTWRALLITLTQVGVEGVRYHTGNVVGLITHRWRSKMEALRKRAALARAKARAREIDWNPEGFSRMTRPVCEVMPDGKLLYAADFKWLEATETTSRNP